ncbi:hypothetical protein GCM10023209_37260 [Roseibacterium beibuensis]|uniref:Gfo/Idh/MocA-like oxidoreductase N-terminal domain-containing protein n=2 Tax=[Roseibacterium] beibuensis TaxID=1193142 RepID=A0ABP9LSQ9_9RHOB
MHATPSETDLLIIGGGEAVRMAYDALSTYEQVAISYLPDTTNSFPSFEFFETAEIAIATRNPKAIYLATPVASHSDLLAKLIEEKKPILVEKPLALNLTQVAGFNTCDTKRVAVAFRKRFSKVASAIKSSRGHKPNDHCTVQIIWLAPHPGPNHWKIKKEIAGGGVLMDIGSHVLDLLEHTIGKISAIHLIDYELEPRQDTESYLSLAVHFENNSDAQVILGWAKEEPFQQIVFSQPNENITWQKDASKPESTLILTSKNTTRQMICHRNDEYFPMFKEFREFTNGTPADLPTWNDGVRNLALISKIYESL